MRILAIDIGIRNLALCMLDNGRIAHWQTVDLSGSDYKPQDNVKLVMEFRNEFSYLFDAADLVIVERQMRVNMRIIEAVLHALSFKKCKVVGARTIKQHFGLCRRDYRQNKKAAVDHVQELLSSCPDDEAHAAQFARTKKRDDLADAYLMALFFSQQEGSSTQA